MRIVLVAALLAVAACSGSGGKRAPEASPEKPTEAAAPEPPPVVSFTPAAGATGVAINAPLQVTIPTGRIVSVRVATGPDDENPVVGQVDADGRKWTSADGTMLALGADYEIAAEVEAKDGSPSTARSTFTTLTPKHKLTARVSPLNNSTVGVGHPIALYLSKPVADRAAVERRLTVTAVPPVTGSWLWVSDSQLRWRPPQYWVPQTKVTFKADLAGVDFGDGTWGSESRNINFTIGDSHISVVDATTYKMTVTTNGVVERTIPVSLGRAKYPTKSGVHVVLDKERTTIMDSASFGVPAGSSESYRTKVEWATRISNSGEFVHSAPWSVRDQGRRHVSHGCVNISPENAKWFFNYSQLGDVVEVKGTPVQIEGTNGFGDRNVAYPPPV